MRWARTRRGSATIVLAFLLSFAAYHSPTQILHLFASLIFTIPIGWLVCLILARAWERNTYPTTPHFARSRPSAQSRQLREDLNASVFRDRGGFLFERRYFFTATGLPPVRLSRAFFEYAAMHRHLEPVQIASNDVRRWWWTGDKFCWENCGYAPRDVLALLAERERKQTRQLERAHTLLTVGELDPRSRREPIPREIQRIVFERDGGRCVECGSNFQVQYDHVIPFSLGGADTPENLQIMCAPCNQAKGARI